MKKDKVFNQIGPVTNGLFHVFLCALALVCLVPLVLVLAISFSPEASITEHGYRLLPEGLTTEGYAYLFKQRTLILRALGMSVFVTVVGTVGFHPHDL